MSSVNGLNRVQKLEQEIVRKEKLAYDAKMKGMNTTYSNYLIDLAGLKSQLQKLKTNPFRAL